MHHLNVSFALETDSEVYYDEYACVGEERKRLRAKSGEQRAIEIAESP